MIVHAHTHQSIVSSTWGTRIEMFIMLIKTIIVMTCIPATSPQIIKFIIKFYHINRP